MPGFGFRRVDAIVRKTDNRPRDPMRIRGALHCTLDEAKGKQGHLFLGREELRKAAFKIPPHKPAGGEDGDAGNRKDGHEEPFGL